MIKLLFVKTTKMLPGVINRFPSHCVLVIATSKGKCLVPVMAKDKPEHILA